tara:strand:+ start:132 stop:344 length:213 start_codon:yes stop_codon:yes gene_type:complete
MKKTKIKKGYKKGGPTGKEVHGGRKYPTTFDWGDEQIAQQFYIKGPGGKFIKVSPKMRGSHKIAKKGGKV